MGKSYYFTKKKKKNYKSIPRRRNCCAMQVRVAENTKQVDLLIQVSCYCSSPGHRECFNFHLFVFLSTCTYVHVLSDVIRRMERLLNFIRNVRKVEREKEIEL